jgi:hypothetical protein
MNNKFTTLICAMITLAMLVSSSAFAAAKPAPTTNPAKQAARANVRILGAKDAIKKAKADGKKAVAAAEKRMEKKLKAARDASDKRIKALEAASKKADSTARRNPSSRNKANSRRVRKVYIRAKRAAKKTWSDHALLCSKLAASADESICMGVLKAKYITAPKQAAADSFDMTMMLARGCHRDPKQKGSIVCSDNRGDLYGLKYYNPTSGVYVEMPSRSDALPSYMVKAPAKPMHKGLRALVCTAATLASGGLGIPVGGAIHQGAMGGGNVDGSYTHVNTFWGKTIGATTLGVTGLVGCLWATSEDEMVPAPAK